MAERTLTVRVVGNTLPDDDAKLAELDANPYGVVTREQLDLMMRNAPPPSAEWEQQHAARRNRSFVVQLLEIRGDYQRQLKKLAGVREAAQEQGNAEIVAKADDRLAQIHRKIRGINGELRRQAARVRPDIGLRLRTLDREIECLVLSTLPRRTGREGRGGRRGGRGVTRARARSPGREEDPDPPPVDSSFRAVAA